MPGEQEPASEHDGVRGDPVPLVGRAAEVDVLRDALARGREGEGTVVDLVGAAGIGKTRLVEEAYGPDADLVLRGQGDELGLELPCSALPPELTPGSIPRVTSPAELGLGAAALAPQVAVVEAVLTAVERRCSDRGVIVWIDDGQWADAATMHVVHALARRLPALPATILVTRRPQLGADRRWRLDERAGDAYRRVDLSPLDADRSVELATHWLGHPPDDSLRAQLVGAGGNPFLLEHVLLAAASGDPEHQHRDALLVRLGSEDAEIREVLTSAAILGREFDLAALSALSGRTTAELSRALADAVRAGLLEDREGGLRFRHDLFREALVADLPGSVRDQLHADAAQVVAGTEDAVAGRVAHHLLAARRPTTAESTEWLVQAGEQLEAHDPDRAVELYERAREGLDPTDLEWGLLGVRIALVPTVDPARAHRLLDEVMDRSPDQRAHNFVHVGRAMLALAGGRLAETVRELTAFTSRYADATDAMSLSALSTARMMTLDLDGSTEAGRQAVAAGSDDPAPIVVAHVNMSTVALVRGAMRTAVAEGHAAVEVSVAAGPGAWSMLHPHVFLARALTAVGDHRGALRVIQESEEEGRRSGSGWEVPLRHAFLAEDLYRQGRLDDALAESLAGLDVAEEHGLHLADLLLRAIEIMVHLHQSRLEDAEQAVASAQASVEIAPTRIGSPQLGWATALVLEADGRQDEALDRLNGVGQLCAGFGMVGYVPMFAPDLARLAVAAKRPAPAESLVDRVQNELDPTEHPTARLLLDRARAWVTGDADLAVRAVAPAEATSHPLEFARASEDAGLLLSHARRREDATRHLEAAADHYERVGASRDAGRVLTRLTGKSAGAPRPANGWGALTPAERRVAGLVAEGLSNPDIALRLVISRRTVETHVSRALAKVGVPSRVQLALIARENEPDQASRT